MQEQGLITSQPTVWPNRRNGLPKAVPTNNFTPVFPGTFSLQRIRDEAHRFAITYHRSLRGKRNLASILDDIPGVGEKRKKNLLQHFGSFKKIREASVEELQEVKGISRKVAEEVFNYLHTHQDLLLRTNNNGD